MIMNYLTPLTAFSRVFIQDFSDVEDMCEPDQTTSLADIIRFSAQGVNLPIRSYDEYDDSPEGADFPLDYDIFDGLNDLRTSEFKSKKKPPVVPLVDPTVVPPVVPIDEPPIQQ